MATKDTEKSAPRPEPAPDAPTALQRLHDEYLRGLCDQADQVEKQLDGALRASMTAIAAIEDEMARKAREAADEYTKAAAAPPANAAPSTGAWFDYQKKLNEIGISARQKEADVREKYLQAWRDATDGLQKMRDKARVDYLRKVQDVWEKMDLGKMDPSHAQVLTARLHTAHAVRDLGF